MLDARRRGRAGRRVPGGTGWVVASVQYLSSAREGRRAARFVLSADAAALLDRVRERYAQWIREGEEDDRLTGTTDKLGQAGYPPLEDLLGSPDLLRLVLGEYLEEEVFTALLPPVADSATVAGTWAIDTVDSVRHDAGRILISGT